MRTLFSYFTKPSPGKQTPRKESGASRMEEEVTPAPKGHTSVSDKASIPDTKGRTTQSTTTEIKKPILSTPDSAEKAKKMPENSEKAKTTSKTKTKPSNRSTRKRKVISYKEEEDDEEYMDEENQEDDEEEAYIPQEDAEDDEDVDIDDEISEEDEIIRPSRKRNRKLAGSRRKVIDEDSEDDDNNDAVHKKQRKRCRDEASMETDVDEKGEETSSQPDSLEVSLQNPESIELSKSKAKALREAKRNIGSAGGGDESQRLSYKAWDFLNPKFRKDKNGKRPGEEGYNSNTLHIDNRYFKDMSPAEAQYWRFKKENMDFILFFKMGKFYELFDDDADIGAQELNLNYMSGKRRHTGFPEKAFDKYAKEFIRLGYKVARVEQVETPKELAERNKILRKQGKKTDKVVRREMIQVLTPGTVSDETMIGHKDANFTISICEEGDNIGVCFVDTSRLKIYVGQFSDDHFRSRLRTLLFQLNPMEILMPRDSLSKQVQLIIRSDLPHGVKKNILAPGSEFWDAETTWMQIRDSKYFETDGEEKFPLALSDIREEKENLAVSAMGGLLYYLRKVMIDEEQFRAGTFYRYKACDPKYRHNMILDAQTLQNLEILMTDQGTREGSLLSHVDRTHTAFGRRLIKEWLMRPLVRLDDINERLVAVEELMSRPDNVREISSKLKKLPDLERLLVRIHANSLTTDKGAVMYENVNAKKVQQFLKILKGYRESLRLIEAIDEPFESSILKKITTIGEGLPDIRKDLDFFDKAFNKSEAEDKGFIIPNKGVNPDFDEAEAKAKDCMKRLESYLRKQQALFNDRSIKYKHLGKEKYQLEISNETLKRKPKSLIANWMLSGSSKKYKRYLSPKAQEIAAELGNAEHDRDTILNDVSRKMFALFCKTHSKWNGVVSCLAQLDCLISLSIVSMDQTPSIKPEFKDSKTSFVVNYTPPHPHPAHRIMCKYQSEIREAVHPTVAAAQNISNTSFIPNDIVIGSAENEARFLLVSGPNMGGKSTLLRQTCVTIVLAQIGCYVPAEHCKLTPVDRIFTRVGANDRIMQGQSTFMVELQETGNILKHATPRSLVILDELGRGTSTFDGTAIAYSVIQYLLDQVKCMSLFSTHYHKLLDEFKNDERIAMYHMACSVQKESVTFLYKFTKGVCKSSYGMNCASLAGVPKDVVQRAKEMARKFEESLSAAHGQQQLTGC